VGYTYVHIITIKIVPYYSVVKVSKYPLKVAKMSILKIMFVCITYVYRVLVEKPEGKRPLGRPRHRWEDNIRMDLQDVG
jgi:hypothetical protein